MSRCRWCSSPIPPTVGRPRTFCDDSHRRAHVEAFGTAVYSGAVLLSADCPTCGWSDEEALPGPLMWPGAVADAFALLADVRHEHQVEVTVSAAMSGTMGPGSLSTLHGTAAS